MLLESAAAAATDQIETTIELDNVSGTDIDLAQYQLRYWFTADAGSGVDLVPGVGSGPLSQRVSIGSVIPARRGADHYVEISFGSETILTGGRAYLTFKTNKSDWSKFDQSDDYSYPGALAVGAELATVGVFRSGVLVAGVEP